jgi:hypothetical protein
LVDYAEKVGMGQIHIEQGGYVIGTDVWKCTIIQKEIPINNINQNEGGSE